MEPITPLSIYRDHYGPGTPGSGRLDHYRYVPIKLGWISSSEMRRPGHINDKPGPSYNKIGLINTYDGNTIEIRDTEVYLNGSFIARAPTGKSKAQKDRFCKAVIWGLMNDEEALKDKLKEISAGPVLSPEAFIQDLKDQIEKVPVKVPAKVKEWIPDIILPDPVQVPGPAYTPGHSIMFMGPRSIFGWHKLGSFMICEEGIPSCN